MTGPKTMLTEADNWAVRMRKLLRQLQSERKLQAESRSVDDVFDTLAMIERIARHPREAKAEDAIDKAEYVTRLCEEVFVRIDHILASTSKHVW